MDQDNKCCPPIERKERKQKNGLLSGILFGLLPHSFCLAFALFSIVGAVTATAFLKNVLLIPNIFSYLVIISLVLASLSIFFYLRKIDCLCKTGLKSKWKYISTVYLITMMVNLFFFYGVIPVLANIDIGSKLNSLKGLSEVSIKVDIPCTGHSFLIMDEIKKSTGVSDVKFQVPDVFKVSYDSKLTSQQKIIAAEIFKTYPATIEQN